MAKLTGDNSRFDSDNNEWETPDELFNSLNNEFKFTIDLAASEKNKKCPLFYSREQNALLQDWKGIGWLNPPFGEKGSNRLSKFVEKAYNDSKKHGSTIVMLIPARTNTNWWHDFCMKGEVRFIRGRPAFKGCKYGLMQPLSIVIFRAYIQDKTKVHLVGSSDVESCDIRYVCLSKETSLKRWEEIRQELIERNIEVWKGYDNEMYARIDKNLRETDPEKMDNWPHEEPFIQEMETEE